MKKNTARSLESLVGGVTILTLLLIGLISILELGPPQIMIYTGATPFNTGLLGTSDIYAETKSIYPNSFVVTDWSKPPLLTDKCEVVVLISISPEIPYSDSEAGMIADFISRCSEKGVLVADESGNSNKLLYLLGSSVRVLGNKVLDVSSRLPYPVAIFNTSWGYGDELTLDIASSLSIEDPKDHYIALSGYIPAAYLANQFGEIGDRVFFDVPIAYEDTYGNTKIFVIGDGSLFLNQIMRSSYKEKYLTLYTEALDNLCRHRSECYVIFDATKYIGGDPVSIIMRGVNPSLLVTPEFIAAAIARIIHPATWLPPAVSWIDSVIQRLVSISNLARVLVISTSVLIISLALLSKTPTRRTDDPIGYKENISIAFEGRISDLVRKPSLTRRDFQDLYKAINEIVYRWIDTKLESNECSEKLASKGADPTKAKIFCKYMKKMGRRANFETIYPPIVRWEKAIKKALKLYEEISSSIDLNSLSTP
ncbi:MAG: hypothetical protein RQ885_05225 [Desulfurococcales archaeon]|jgi:hypothetical protein|nr:hypothetical protein [Desulfurococcales archaeon]